MSLYCTVSVKKLFKHADTYRACDKEKTLSFKANPFFLQKNLFKSLTASTCLYLPRRNSAAVEQIQVPQINTKSPVIAIKSTNNHEVRKGEKSCKELIQFKT